MKLSKIVLRFVSISFTILVILIVIVFLMKLGSYCYDFGYRVFTEEPVDEKPGKDVVVSITSDLSAREIGELLEDKGLINDSWLFVVQLKLSAYSNSLEPGTYTLNTSMTARDMMVVMADDEDYAEDTEDE